MRNKQLNLFWRASKNRQIFAGLVLIRELREEARHTFTLVELYRIWGEIVRGKIPHDSISLNVWSVSLRDLQIRTRHPRGEWKLVGFWTRIKGDSVDCFALGERVSCYVVHYKGFQMYWCAILVSQRLTASSVSLDFTYQMRFM